jgi:hypothetical protein
MLRGGRSCASDRNVGAATLDSGNLVGAGGMDAISAVGVDGSALPEQQAEQAPHW